MKNITMFSSKIALTSLALTAGLIANEPVDMEQNLPIKGEAWQLFGFNEEIDLDGTFNGTSVRVVWAWDNVEEDWVAYSPQYATKTALEDANHTMVDRLQPNQGFWIMSYEDIAVNLKEVYYPLYNMCVNLNSDDFWENKTDENGLALTQPFYQCEDYIAELPQFVILEESLELLNSENQARVVFTTNLPTVFVKNLVDNIMTPISDITGFEQYIDANGSISNIEVNRTFSDIENNEVTEIAFDLDETLTESSYLDLTMFIGNSVNIEDSIKIMLPIARPQVDDNTTE